MNTIKLAQKFISIPSFVDERNNEKKIADFLFQYIRKSCPWLKIAKQKVEKDRYNIIATDGHDPKLLLTAHMDTVQPKQGWKFDQFQGKIINGKMYGLGACDMKSGIAAAVKAIEKNENTKGLMFLLYIDEEYDFKGMLKFIQEYKKIINPKIIFSADGNGMKLGNGCRGIIDVSFLVRGKTAHAADPAKGRNAITGTVQAVKEIEEMIRKFEKIELRKPTVNIAYLQGGLDLGKENELVVGKRGNNIPDIAEAVLEIRTTSSALNAKTLRKLLQKLLKPSGLRLVKYSVTSDYGSWLTPKQKLKFFGDILRSEKIKLQYCKIGKFGYLDTQMLWKIFQCDAVAFGIGENGHAVNENCKLSDLSHFENIIDKLIKEFCL